MVCSFTSIRKGKEHGSTGDGGGEGNVGQWDNTREGNSKPPVESICTPSPEPSFCSLPTQSCPISLFCAAAGSSVLLGEVF